MGAQQKRLQVTLSPEARALVEELHQLEGKPRSAIVAEILDHVAPVFQETIEALRVARAHPEKAAQIMQREANKAVAQVAQASLDLDSALDGRSVRGARSRRRNARAT